MIDGTRRSVYGGSQVLIMGVSARAAAFSALRAGFCPVAVDCFQDEDLAAACDGLRIDGYPDDLEHAANAFPPCPWLYTGGLENHPQLVDRIADERVLYGNPGHVLRAVRDPFRLADTLRSEGLPSLPVSVEPPVAAQGTWLRKPRKSGGGRGIAFASLPPHEHQGDSPWNDRLRAETRAEIRAENGRFYYQQYVAGMPCSAVFVGAGRKALWLGATQQLIGAVWAGAQGFEYAGSLGPLDVRADQRRQWERIGQALAGRFGLSGLFGVDAVMTEEAIWVVEVNPRYTASIEVLELACGLTTMVPHVIACLGGELPAEGPDVPQPCGAPSPGGLTTGWSTAPCSLQGKSSRMPEQRVGKAIVYARHTGCVPTGFDDFVRRLNQDPARPAVADIPRYGFRFSAGEPLVTVLAYATSLPAVAQSLHQTVASVQAALGGV